jgi:aspartate aminotransferase-like enzyme
MQTPTIAKPIENGASSVLPPVTIHISFEMLLSAVETLPKEQKWQLYQTLGAELAPQSAEAKAIARLQDEDDPSQWITVIEADEEIDEAELDAWLVKRGYQKTNV